MLIGLFGLALGLMGPSGETMALVATAREELAGPSADLWPGWTESSFGMVLVGGDDEHLICDDRAPDGFGPAEVDPVTGCDIRARPRTFPPGLLAAFPAFGPPAVVVVGEPDQTGLSDAAWSLTLLHEHFHQHQMASTDYFARVEALDLSGGDETGMWMLTYAFPYADPQVAALAQAAAAALADALDTDGEPTAEAARRYLSARARLAAQVEARDWRYAEFQMWQEGVSRWTEIAAAARSADPAWREAGEQRRREMLEALSDADLAEQQRLVFYALGAAEAELMERCGLDWRAGYFDQLELGPLVAQTLEACA